MSNKYPNHMYNLGDYDKYGVPDYLMKNDTSTIQRDTIYRLIDYFPNNESLEKLHPDLLESTNSKNLIINKNDTYVDVYVTFLYENAGYKNVVGYYVYPLLDGNTSPMKYVDKSLVPLTLDDINSVDEKGNSIYKKTIIFPNTSLPSWDSSEEIKKGNLLSGSSVRLVYDTNNPSELFPSNTGIGFFIISDGFNKGIINDGLTFYTDDDFNPDGIRQTVMLLDTVNSNSENGKLIIGFEDILRTKKESGIDKNSDSDFNDVMICVTYTPVDNIDVSKMTILPDSIKIDETCLMVDNTGIYFQLTTEDIDKMFSSGIKTFYFYHNIQCSDEKIADQIYQLFSVLTLANNFALTKNKNVISLITLLTPDQLQNYIYIFISFVNRKYTSPLNDSVSCIVDMYNIYCSDDNNDFITEDTVIYDYDNEKNIVFEMKNYRIRKYHLCSPYAMGDPHIMTIYGEKYDLPNDMNTYMLYKNDDVMLSVKLNKFYMNQKTEYDHLTFIHYVFLNVGRHELICNMFHPNVYCTFNPKTCEYTEINTIDPFFKVLDSYDVSWISKDRIKKYQNDYGTSTFVLKFIRFDTFMLGEIYIELMFMPHRRDFVSSVGIVSNNLLLSMGSPMGAMVNKNLH